MVVIVDVLVIGPLIVAVHGNVNPTLIVIRPVDEPEHSWRPWHCTGRGALVAYPLGRRRRATITSTVAFPFPCTADDHGLDHDHAVDHDQRDQRMTVGAQVETPAPTIVRFVVGVMPLSVPFDASNW